MRQRWVGCVDLHLYNPQYFYQKETWHYSCSMACQALISVYHHHQLSKIWFNEWLNVICESCNSIIQGFLMEQLCLVIIAHDGLCTIYCPHWYWHSVTQWRLSFSRTNQTGMASLIVWTTLTASTCQKGSTIPMLMVPSCASQTKLKRRHTYYSYLKKICQLFCHGKWFSL